MSGPFRRLLHYLAAGKAAISRASEPPGGLTVHDTSAKDLDDPFYDQDSQLKVGELLARVASNAKKPDR